MEPTEFIIAAISIIAGTGLAAYIFGSIFKLIRTWLGRDRGYDEEIFERLARAFMQHKKDTERRLQNLEAIVSDGNEDKESSVSAQIEQPTKTIDVEIEEDKPDQKSGDKTGNNLRNMLRE